MSFKKKYSFLPPCKSAGHKIEIIKIRKQIKWEQAKITSKQIRGIKKEYNPDNKVSNF